MITWLEYLKVGNYIELDPNHLGMQSEMTAFFVYVDIYYKNNEFVHIIIWIRNL